MKIEDFKRFINNLIKENDRFLLKNIDEYKKSLEVVLPKLVEIDNRKQDYIKANAPYFNIFNIMRYGYYENRLHTPFLINLLSPNGHHQLGATFLKHLIDEIFGKSLDVYNIKQIKIYEEYTFNDGRIDIFISFSHCDKYYFIVIENKIHAYDQEKQLERYYNFLLKQIGNPTEQPINSDTIRLIYLTKNGNKPSKDSLEEEKYKNLSEKKILWLLSYKCHISCWIKKLIDKQETPISVREVLTQYLNTINNF